MKSIGTILISCFISATLTFLGQSWWYNKENETKYLDVYVSFQDFNDVKNDDVHIEIDSTTIKHLHRVDVWIYNFNDRDLENVPVYLELWGIQGGTPKLYSANVWGRDLSPELVEKMTDVGKPANSSGIRFGYNLLNAKKGPFESPTFYGSFLIDSPDISKWMVTIGKPGIDARKYEFDNYYSSYQFPRKFFDYWWSIIVFIVIAIIIGLLLVFISNRIQSDKAWLKQVRAIMPQFIDYLNTNKSESDVDASIEKYHELRNKYLWENSSKFARFLNNYKKPE